jgi:hypothetical protein
MRRRRLTTAGLLLLWTVLALYPNPLLLGRAAAQSWTPVIDADAVRDLAATLPDDPRLIEEAVLTRIVPYGVPWEVYGVPWYFPTPAEVLAAGRGDCQGRAVVLASLLQAKGIPFTLAASFDHIWVDYPGKNPTPIENARVAIAQKAPDAQYGFRLPIDWDLRRSWEIEWEYFVAPAPGWRLLLLALGWVLILQRRRVLDFLRSRVGSPAVSEVRPS